MTPTWELRFARVVLAGWVAATALFALWHIPAAWRYTAGRDASGLDLDLKTRRDAQAEGLCRWGLALGDAHPFEASEDRDTLDLLRVLREVGVDVSSVEEAAEALAAGTPPQGLRNPEGWPLGSPLPDVVTLLQAVTARQRGQGIDKEAQALFVRRPEWWNAIIRGWPRAPVTEAQLTADATVWAKMIERREAAVASGHVFLGFLAVGIAVLGLGSRTRSRKKTEGRRTDSKTEGMT
jgi:hypothetical protein